MSKKKGLGQGVNALFHSEDMTRFNSSVNEKGELVLSIPVKFIQPNPNQPRKFFDDATIDALALSIDKVGLLQPISVTEEQGSYFLVAGERRLRAVKKLGHKEIKAIVVNADPRLVAELALIENLQREDLNPVDEANAYLALTMTHRMTHEMISDLVGKSRAHISNYIRLLGLGKEELDSLREGKISVGHAKVLLSIKDRADRMQLLKRCVEEALSVREAERLAVGSSKRAESKHTAKKQDGDANQRRVERRLEDKFGTKVKIRNRSEDSGSIVIEFYSREDRERLLELLFHVEQ